MSAPIPVPADLARTAAAERARRWLWPGGLSARLLLLTVLFVMLAEALILAPSLASYEEQRLEERVRDAELASLAVEASPDQVVSDTVSAQLRAGAGLVQVAVQSEGIRRLLLPGPPLAQAPTVVDLRTRGPLGWLLQPFEILTGPPQQMLE